jgi:iron complex outermembrane receptor protein
VTFFNYKILDEIVPFVINQLTYYRNAGKTNRTGVEVGVKSHIFPELELTTNYTYANFSYDEYKTTLIGPSGMTMVDYTGNVVPSVPKHILNLILNYEFEISESFSGLLQWDCDYVSLMYVNDANSESVSPYFYGNVMAGISCSASSINAVFYAGLNNIWDKRYVGYITVNDYYGRYYETGEPRNVHMGLNVSLLL